MSLSGAGYLNNPAKWDKLIPEDCSLQFENDGVTITSPTLLSYGNNHTIFLKKGGNAVASICLSGQPYCCGAVFFSNLISYVANMGYGNSLLKIAIRFAEVMGYNSISCIIPKEYGRGIHTFEKNGFVLMQEVTNARTQNDLRWYHKTVGLSYADYCNMTRGRSVPSPNFKEYK